MSNGQRVGMIILSVLQFLAALLIFALPGAENGLLVILLILSFGLAVSGVQEIIRYFTTARFMVGGRLILFFGVVLFDLGLFSFSLYDASSVIVSLYLIGVFMFSGVVDILMARESRRLTSPRWKLRGITGIVKILLGVACLVFVKNAAVLGILFGVSLVYSAVFRIISAFRKTEAAYIQ